MLHGHGLRIAAKGRTLVGATVFKEEEFKKYFQQKTQLMQSLLAGYVTKNPNLTNTSDVHKYSKSLISYHTKGDKGNIEEIFFKTFKHTNFQYKDIHDADKEYPYKLFASNLFTFNLPAYKVVKKQLEDSYKLFTTRGQTIYWSTHVNNKEAEKFISQDIKCPVNYITSFFKRAWDHQADGWQTNATLILSSIVTMAEHMHRYELIKTGDAIVDCGSSYGSLILAMVNLLETFDISVKGFGIEYATIRHKLGTEYFSRMLNKMIDCDVFEIF